MPDVTNPQAEKEVPEQVEEEKPQFEETQPEQTPEQAPETPPETTEQPEEPSGPSAAELQAQLAEKEAEIERLKTEKPSEPAPKNEGIQHLNINNFVHRVMPEAKKVFVNPQATVEQQFDTIINTTDQMLGAVMQDQINPHLKNLASANIELSNELQIRDLRAEDPTFRKTIESKVRAELKSMDWKSRGESDAVQKIYYRIIGQTNGNKPQQKFQARVAASVLKDVSATRPSPSPKANGIRLTAEQEADRQAIIEEGSNISPENYIARLKARQDRMKATNQRIPTTLRGL